MSDLLVTVDNVSKKFCRDLKRSLWYGVKDISSELFGGINAKSQRLRKDEFWAVRDVSFELRRGECLGLIGHNGAGKSTLLKMLNGLIKPDKGNIEMRGRVGALIELGAGFNPLLTGRENVYINGTILGFTKSEIDSKFDSIIEFAELEDFVDSPVQNYSSGMKVRLGFAVASQMEPDILIIDEVLAVGDVGFSIKSFNAISEIAKNAAVIFVSHSMPQVARVASDILLLSKGEKVFYDRNISEGIEAYYSLFENSRYEVYGQGINIVSCEVNQQLQRSINVKYQETLDIVLVIQASIELSEVKLTIGFVDKSQKLVAIYESIGFDLNDRSLFRLRIQIPNLLFSIGVYSLTFSFENFVNQKRNIVTRYRALKELHFSGLNSVNHASFVLPGDCLIEIHR